MPILKYSPLSKAVKNALVFGALCTVSSGLVQAEEKPEKDANVVQIVGSHIRRADIEGASPVQIIDREQIDNSGYNSVQELLFRLPSVGAGNFNSSSDSQDSTSIGSSGISFRGLGADKTLVLLNGRRVTVSPFANGISTAFVDLNSIPISAIQRVEILKDGASATYGSDAIAAVINIVLRNDFEGAELSVGFGDTTDTDSNEKTLNLIWGTSNQGDHVTLVLDYFKREALYLRDRSYSRTADQSANEEGDDARSSSPEFINFQDPVTGVFSTDPGCPVDRLTDLGSDGVICRYDYAPDITSVPDAERTGLLGTFEHEFKNGVIGFSEFQYQHNTGSVSGAPSPSFNEFSLAADNPNNPFDQDLTQFRRRFVEAGPRVFDFVTDNTRLLVGLKGMMGEWDWEVGYNKSRSQSVVDSSSGFVRSDLIQQALDDGSFNPFGGVLASNQAAVDNFTTDVHRSGVAHTDVFDGKVSGPIMEMPHGALSAAFGFEYRQEDIRDTPDAQFARRVIVGTENTAATGNRSQWSAYSEFIVPVLENLDVQVAVRYEDYDDFGTTTNPKISARYQPMDNLMLRASWGTAFRAPSLVQTGLGATNESPTLIDSVRCPLTGAELDCGSSEYIANFSGNPDLQPEQSESINLGGVWQINDNMNIGLDYWNYDLTDVIDKDTQGLLVQEAKLFAATGQLMGDVIVREPQTVGEAAAGIPGRISFINDSFFNVGSRKTDGFDFDYSYVRDIESLGKFKFGLDWTHVLSFDEKKTPTSQTEDLNGEYRRPEDRWSTSLDWARGDWGATARVIYIGEFKDNKDLGKTRTVNSMTTLNLQARYMGIQDTLITVGMDNVFDQKPPYSASEFQGYEFTTHSPRGQFAYAKVTLTF